MDIQGDHGGQRPGFVDLALVVMLGQIVEVNVNKTKSLTTMAPSLRLYLHSVFLAVDMLLKSFSCFCYHQKAFSNVQMLFALVHHAEFQSKVPDHHGHQLYIMDG